MQPTFLQPGEEPVRVERRHVLSALDAWLGIGLLLLVVWAGVVAVTVLVGGRASPVAVAAGAVVSVAAAGWAVAVWFRVTTSLSVITADRVYHAHGRLRFFLAQTTYDRVTDLHVHQSLFGRRFRFGTVVVQTAGQGVHLVGVRDPLGVKRDIEAAREAMVRRLVAAHKRSARTAATAGEAPLAASVRGAPSTDTPPLWTGAPTAASFVVQIVPFAFFLVPFALMTAGGAAFTGPAALLVPAGLAVVLAAMVANMAIRLRTTRYEVHGWGVAVASGWLGRSRVETRYEKVTDVAVTQGVAGRLFGFGTIRVNTAGGPEAPISFDGVRHPDLVKAIVDRARQGLAP